MEKLLTIIVEGSTAVGKTRLGSLLTFNGRAGVVIEADELRGSSGRILYTDAWLRRIEFCPRVVIITTSPIAEVIKHPRLQPLLAARASLDHNLELLRLDAIPISHWPDTTPILFSPVREIPPSRRIRDALRPPSTNKRKNKHHES